MYNNPNTIKSYKILQKLSLKHVAHGVAQSTYPIYRHGKACLSKQPPWRAAGDPHLARGRSQIRAPGPAGALRALFFSTLPSFLLLEIDFWHLPHQPRKSVRVMFPLAFSNFIFSVSLYFLQILKRQQNSAGFVEIYICPNKISIIRKEK